MNLKLWDWILVAVGITFFALDYVLYNHNPQFIMVVLFALIILVLSLMNDVKELKDLHEVVDEEK